MPREVLAEAGQDVGPLTAAAFSLGPCALEHEVPQLLCRWIPDKPPPSPAAHTLGQTGCFIPTFIKVLEPWVGVWLVPKEEWTECKSWT